MSSVRERVNPKMNSQEILDYLRRTEGYFLTNNERDVSQSDFKGSHHASHDSQGGALSR
jgi:hypothetical protein